MATTLIPVLGPFAPMVLTPVLSVGVMHAVRAADRGQTAPAADAVRRISRRGGRAWQTLLVLGGLNTARDRGGPRGPARWPTAAR